MLNRMSLYNIYNTSPSSLQSLKTLLVITVLLLLTACGGGSSSSTPSTNLDQPVLTVSSVTTSSITVSWTAVSGASSYTIYYHTGSNVQSGETMQTQTTATTLSNLQPNTSYYIGVIASNANVSGSLSEIRSTRTHEVFLAKPTLLVGKVSTSSVELSWTTVTGATDYDIYYAKASIVSLDSLENIGTLSSGTQLSNQTSPYTIGNLTENTTYYFMVSAYSSLSEVSTSNEVVAMPQASRSFNDTGITVGGNYSTGNNSTCTSNISTNGKTVEQDCNHGRDAEATAGTLIKVGSGSAGFDFTKLSSTGTALSIQDKAWSSEGTEAAGTQWSCVVDNRTGLVWEVKTDSNKGNTYRWGGKTAIGREHADRVGSYYNDWDALVDDSNNGKLCGSDGWRVPSLEELRSIVDYGKYNSNVIDTHYFPNTQASWYWTSSPYAYTGSATSGAWYLSFLTGSDTGNYGVFRSNRNHVRLVRSDHSRLVSSIAATPISGQTIPSYIDNEWPDSRYTIHANHTVTDEVTKLMWKRCSEGQSWSNNTCSGAVSTMTWKVALEHAYTHEFAGYSNWRLPNVKELASLVARDRYHVPINLTVFPNTRYLWYWSSSPAGEDKAWGTASYTHFIDFAPASYVRSDGNGKRGNGVRLVRSID